MAARKTSTSNNEDDLDLRKEFDELKDQVTKLAELLSAETKEHTSRLGEKLEDTLEKVQERAEEQLQEGYETATERLEEVGGYIRRNPMASLLIAFGAGYIISKVLGSDR